LVTAGYAPVGQVDAGRSFSDDFKAWRSGTSGEHASAVERKLLAALDDEWNSGDTDTRKEVLDFIYLSRADRVDIIISGLHDDDIQVAALALTTIALMVWRHREIDVPTVRAELAAFALRHPAWANVCTSIAEKLHQGH
jgi:hypothetical protein